MKTKSIGILVLLCIMLGIVPPASAWSNPYSDYNPGYIQSSPVSSSITNAVYEGRMNHNVYIIGTMNPYIVNSRGMTYNQLVTFKSVICNAGKNPEYGIDYSIRDVSAGRYVVYKRDAFNLEVGQCRTMTTSVPLDQMPSVWGSKYWSGSAKSLKYIVGAEQNGNDDNPQNNYVTHTMWVKPPIYY